MAPAIDTIDDGIGCPLQLVIETPLDQTTDDGNIEPLRGKHKARGPALDPPVRQGTMHPLDDVATLPHLAQDCLGIVPDVPLRLSDLVGDAEHFQPAQPPDLQCVKRIRLPIRIRRHVEDARTPCIPQQLTVELRPALGPDLSLKCPADVEIATWAQFLGYEIPCPVPHALLDVVPRDHEILAVVARTPNDQMDMRMGGVPVIDADPVKRCAEILLHPPDEIAGEGLQVGHVRRVVG
mgnify:FL=1